jgi:ribosome-associated protein
MAGFTDYFLICHGGNIRQIQTIADEIQRVLQQKDGLRPSHVEGYQNGEWVVLDYLDYVVHIFSQRSRDFYALERIWQKAPRMQFEGTS